MKKIMIWSGALSVFTLIFGIWFKFMHWPGAGMLMSTGILSSSLIFLPLVFTLKAKEKQKTKDKFVLALAAIGVILVCLSFLFKVMHWPYSVELVYISAILMLFVFLPIYFLSGIKNEETKLNTITTSLLVVMVYGLLFMLVRAPSAQLHANMATLQELGIGSEILMNEQRLASGSEEFIPNQILEINSELEKISNECSNYIRFNTLKVDTSIITKAINSDLHDQILNRPFKPDELIQEKLNAFKNLVENYNLEMEKIGSKKLSRIRTTAIFLDNKIEGIYQLTNANVLHQLTQIRMLILQNNRTIVTLNKGIKKAEQSVQLSTLK